MSRPRLLLSVTAALACACATSCVELSPDGNAVTNVVGPPYGSQFQASIAANPEFASTYFMPLGVLLGHRCGSLDCHGQVGRNLRIYSQYGLRLSPMDFPGGHPTTPDEFAADYRSACGLEPELMSQVVMDMGAGPDRLTLVRKPRAEESHKGGQLFMIGDDQDTCMVSWLASDIDTTACTNAVENTP
jgi:hypothetical protein